MSESKVPRSGKVEIKPFSPKALTGGGVQDYSETKKKFGALSSLDRSDSAAFNLHPASKRFLGVERQEKDHVEGLVRAEVDARIAEIREQAYREGVEQGRADGSASAEAEYREKVRPVFEALNQQVLAFDAVKSDLFAANEAFLVQLVFQVARQVILKELSVDREYVKRLLVHVIEKMGAKDHIRIKVNQKDFEDVEGIKDFLKAAIPDLRNIQIEGSDELPLGGCKVETDLSRINASIENQLGSIEKVLGEA
ncbi:hypothetical protein EBZ37_07295 [bacterium]|nr:hypothetical protein [bacterium]